MELAEFFETQAVWDKGTREPGRDSREWRRDDYRALIRRSDYGNRQSIYGWEKGHIFPRVRGGQDELSNLRPLHWRNNLFEGSGGPLWPPWRGWSS
jgi:hypothetical protein